MLKALSKQIKKKNSENYKNMEQVQGKEALNLSLHPLIAGAVVQVWVSFLA